MPASLSLARRGAASHNNTRSEARARIPGIGPGHTPALAIGGPHTQRSALMAEINWVKDWDQAFSQAKSQGKKVYVDFFKDG
jgi:hypothetical protein